MTAQRSMSDEQLSARWDQEPWVNGRGERFATFNAGADASDPFDPAGSLRLAPRPECIPSRDPLPWSTQNGWHRFASKASTDVYTDNGKFDPRQAFARPPVNPILSAFRDEQRMYSVMGDEDGQLRDYLFLLGGGWEVADIGGLPTATPSQVDFARKVLTRLAALSVTA